MFKVRIAMFVKRNSVRWCKTFEFQSSLWKVSKKKKNL